MSALARRAVACKGWRWMPGMLTEFGDRYTPEGGAWCSETWRSWPTRYPRRSIKPDLEDPATRGCVLALVRAAWGDPYAYTYRLNNGKWRVWGAATHLPAAQGTTEAEALVAALENAP